MAIKAIISWLGFHKAVEAPPEVRAEFKLFFEELLVGTLSVADSLWGFEYSRFLVRIAFVKGFCDALGRYHTPNCKKQKLVIPPNLS